LPAPNLPGQNNGTLNNYSASGSGTFNDYQYVIRGDYTANEKLQIFGRYTHSNFKLSGKPVFGAIGGPGLGYLGLAGQSLINNYSLATGFNYTLNHALDGLSVWLLPLQPALNKVRPGQCDRSLGIGVPWPEHL